MSFTPKDWRDWPDTTTSITAAALEDLEQRVYTAAVTDAAVPEHLDVTDATANTNSVLVTPTANKGNSTSTGGALNVTNTGSTGAGVVVFTNRGADAAGRLMVLRSANAAFSQSALHVDYLGTNHAVTIDHKGTGAASLALSVSSTNPSDTALGVTGNCDGRGTVKVTHNKSGTDTNASILSMLINGAGTACQGIFLDTGSGVTTTGKLINLRQNGTEVFVVLPEGDATVRGTALQRASAVELSERPLYMDFSDAGTFSAARGEWDIPLGTAPVISGGSMATTSASEVIALRSGERMADHASAIKITTPASLGSNGIALVTKYIDASNFLYVQVASHGAGGGIRRRLAGVDSVLLTMNPTIAPSASYWLVQRMVRNTIYMEWWTTDPALGGSPAQSGFAVLSAADAAVFGSTIRGSQGFRMTVASTYTFEDLFIRPFSGIDPRVHQSSSQSASEQAVRMDFANPEVFTNGEMVVTAGTVPVFVSGAARPASIAEHAAFRANERYGDVEVECRIDTPGTLAASSWYGVAARQIDGDNYLFGVVTNSDGTIRIYKKDGGTFTQLGSARAASFGTNGTYWLRLRVVGDDVAVDWFIADPATGALPNASTHYRLAAGNATKFGAGVRGSAGYRWDAKQTDVQISDLAIRPLSGPTLRQMSGENSEQTVFLGFGENGQFDPTRGDWDLVVGEIPLVNGGKAFPRAWEGVIVRRVERMANVEFVAKIRTPPSYAATGAPWAYIARYLDSSNYLMARWNITSATTSVLEIYKKDGGTYTQLRGMQLPVHPTAGTDYWMRCTYQGDTVTVEWWATDPNLGGTPEISVSHRLTSGDATKFGPGNRGRVGYRYLAEPNCAMDDAVIRPLPTLRRDRSRAETPRRITFDDAAAFDPGFGDWGVSLGFTPGVHSGGIPVPTGTTIVGAWQDQIWGMSATMRIKTPPAAWADGSYFAIVHKAIDNGNYLYLRFDAGTGSNGRLAMAKRDAFSDIGLIVTASDMPLATNTSYWLRTTQIGNWLRVEWFTVDPQTNGTPDRVLTYELFGGDATKYGETVRGGYGMRLWATSDNWTVEELDYVPLRPGQLPLGGLQHVQPFTGSGTWVPPGWAKYFPAADTRCIGVCAGQSGGSGGVYDAGVACSGGGGGAPGGVSDVTVPTREMGSSVAVTIPAAPLGGAAVSSGPGNPGAAPSSHTVIVAAPGSIKAYRSGAAPLGGSTSTGTGGPTPASTTWTMGPGASGPVGAAGLSTNWQPGQVPVGGAGGGGIDVGNNWKAGGTSGGFNESETGTSVGGGTNGAAGTNGSSNLGAKLFGSYRTGAGGGGGASGVGVNGGNGGNGGNYGGGGAGGGAARTGNSSGKGGNGGAALALLITTAR